MAQLQKDDLGTNGEMNPKGSYTDDTMLKIHLRVGGLCFTLISKQNKSDSTSECKPSGLSLGNASSSRLIFFNSLGISFSGMAFSTYFLFLSTLSSEILLVESIVLSSLHFVKFSMILEDHQHKNSF